MNIAGAIPWTNQDLILYHGTNERAAESIDRWGINLNYSREMLDFGRGFYTTTSREQAVLWARRRAAGPYYNSTEHGEPKLCVFNVRRDDFADLRFLSFVRGTSDAEDFWSFVRFCRTTNKGLHGRNDWYDTVIGPVTRGIRPRLRVVEGWDQISFHTETGLSVLGQTKVEAI
jgi:hypothetical protein